MTDDKCGACSEPLRDRVEYCWYCPALMCGPCWEDAGHCGHPEADAINAASRLVAQPQRREMAKAIGGFNEPEEDPAP